MSTPNTLYFLTVYGFQTFPDWLRTAHTFAVATKRTVDGSAPDGASIISWLPDAGTIHLFGAEKGRNYSIEQTQAFKPTGAVVRAAPTEEVTEEFYNSFLARKAELEGGTIEYMMNDNPNRRPNIATNCIHAVSDLPIVLNAGPMLDTHYWHGYAASWAVYRCFEPWFIRTSNGVRGATRPVEPGIQAESLDHNVLVEARDQYLRQQEALANLLDAFRPSSE
jgi:hypothetical protein